MKSTRRELSEEIRMLFRNPCRVLSPSACPRTTCQAYVEGLNWKWGRKAVLYCSPGDFMEVIIPQKKGNSVHKVKAKRKIKAKTRNHETFFLLFTVKPPYAISVRESWKLKVRFPETPRRGCRHIPGQSIGTPRCKHSRKAIRYWYPVPHQ